MNTTQSKANSKTPNSTKKSNEEEERKFFFFTYYTPAMWVGGLGLILILLLFGSGAFTSERTLTCPQSSSVPCGNPYYEFGCTSNDYCGVRFLAPGDEYVLVEAIIPMWVHYTYSGLVWLLLIVGFIRNYKAYQRGEV